MKAEETLPIYVVYFNTTDYPGEYVARRQVCGPGWVEPDAELCARGPTLDNVRKQLPRGLHRIPPQPGDDPVVLEIWL